MAISGVLGGIIATELGFKALFLTAGATCLLATIPYFIYLKKGPDELSFT